MTSENLREIAQEAMNKAITETLDSAIIFKYISNLEKEIKKKDKIIDKYIAYIWKYDLNESKEWIKNYIENEWEDK